MVNPYLVDTNATHRSNSQSPNERVGIFAVLDEGVDGHDGHVRLTLGVVHQVEINQLLQFEVVRLHAVRDIRKESANIFANGHGRNDLKNE